MEGTVIRDIILTGQKRKACIIFGKKINGHTFTHNSLHYIIVLWMEKKDMYYFRKKINDLVDL